jgi:hypothetical protein
LGASPHYYGSFEISLAAGLTPAYSPNEKLCKKALRAKNFLLFNPRASLLHAREQRMDVQPAEQERAQMHLQHSVLLELIKNAFGARGALAQK